MWLIVKSSRRNCYSARRASLYKIPPPQACATKLPNFNQRALSPSLKGTNTGLVLRHGRRGADLSGDNSFMKLTLRDVARVFGVHENTVRRWMQLDGLPVQTVNSQYRFNSVELLEWASVRKILFSAE